MTRTFALEYRYDGDGRVRYYERDRDPDDLAPIGENTEKWREFLGSSVYSDLAVVEDGGDLASQKSRRYVHAADGQLVAWFDVPDSEHPSGQWHFVHADMLGTTRLVTDDAGDVGSGLAYTAFGELAGSAFPGGPAATSRYGYCGGWGYEDDTLATLGGGSDPVAGLGLLHVGARWYAPRLGRFTQRDPIGVFAGLNPYVYCSNSPLVIVDPNGHEGQALGQVAVAMIVCGVFAKIMGGTLQIVGDNNKMMFLKGVGGAINEAGNGMIVAGTILIPAGPATTAAGAAAVSKRHMIKKGVAVVCEVVWAGVETVFLP